MKRPSIKTALVSSFTFLGLLIAGIGIFSLVELDASNSRVRSLATDWLPSVEGIKEMDTALSDLRAAYRDHILSLDDETERKANEEIAFELARFAKATDHYETLVVEPEEKAALNEIRQVMTRYSDAGKQLVTLSSEQKDEEAKQALAKMRVDADEIAARIDQIVASNMKGSAAAYADSEAAYATVFWIMLATVAGAAALSASLIVFAARGIAAPIDQITDVMGRLAAGDKSVVVPHEGRADEIGAMAAAVTVFRDNAIRTETLEGESAAQRNQAEAERERLAREDRARAEEMAGATRGLAIGLKELAGGNLTVVLDRPFAQDFEGLRSDFNLAVSQLRTAMGAVADAVTSIDGGSREISTSAQDLSKRTEQQASSLEETAAALDEITSNVANASKRTEEARTVAIAANKSAHQSGEVVSQAVNAMHRIEESSGKISNIIGVIDEIAFQTNLLALNAGVEAARAGEAGKGFAVVAQEVRELAQRSAQAAKEIKGLIQASASEVSTGVKLVNETGEALKVIEAHVVNINGQLDAIATAAREQATGLAEVNTAVNQMDQVTQQNAAMVEESTAASASLASESVRLQGLIAGFRIDGHAGGHPAARVAPPMAPLRKAVSEAAGASAPVTSPARQMMARVSQAMGGSAVQKLDNWEEF